ncbi:hypothetical protein [Leuconostoc gasicomitatum]|uniref:hypothetical protein n=1 Tax=Leuconostoc gasicomitatum TaxID=115778 RepID=UPI0007448A01|nr:hypothetical protein [Leuconostoc gasicomitatum]CUR63472.1 Uncharacterized protein LEKG_0885 [Leuconostoc gasicomitatum KG16-1]
MNKKVVNNMLLKHMPPRILSRRTGIDIYLLDAHQKYGEPIGELTEEQQAALDKWCDLLQ